MGKRATQTSIEDTKEQYQYFVTFDTSNTAHFLITHLPFVKHIESLKRSSCFAGERVFLLELIIFTLP